MKRFLVIVLILIVIAGSYVIYTRTTQPKQAETPTDTKTAAVTRGTIQAVVSATGNIAAERTQNLTFGASGVVAKVLVDEGQTVQAGQVLAVLDGGDLDLSLKQAEAALKVSEAQLAKTLAGPAVEDITGAEVAVTIAQAGITTAEGGLAAARANLARAKLGSTAEAIAIAERQVEEAKNSLWGAQAQRDAICGRIKYGLPESDCDNAQASVQRLEQGVAIAELQLQSQRAGPRQEDVDAAAAQVQQSLGQLESARAQVVRAENDLARAKKGASAEDIAIVQAQVEQARVSVEIARSRLADLELRAPVDGVLSRWSVLVGDSAAPSAPVGVLLGAARYHVNVAIDETEVGRLQRGQDVRLTLDAFPEQELHGTVARISEVGANAQGIITYDVRIDLDAQDLAIRPGMTAALDIIVETKEGVLLVSSRAIRRDKQGKYVQVIKDGVPTRADITVGVSDSEQSEVLSGLEEGQQVVVALERTSMFAGSPFGGQ